MIILPSCIEGILFGRRENRAKQKCKSSWRDESENSKNRDSHVTWSISALALAGAGSSGVVPRQEQSSGMGRDPEGSLGSRAPPTWEPRVPWDLASQVTPWPLRTASWGGKGGNLIFGVCLFLLAKGEWGSSSSFHPSAPEVWLHPRAVTRRKKLRVPVGKSL